MIHLAHIFKTRDRPFKYLLSQFLYETGLCRLFSIYREEYILRFFPSQMSCSLWVDPHYGIHDILFFRSYLKPGDTAIDVGANIGHLALLFSSLVKETGNVYAIEAHPTVYSYLIENIRINRRNNMKTFNLAAGNEDGEIHITDKKADDQNIISYDSSGIKTRLARIDTLPIEETEIHLMKIDVEGYEKFVLDGAEETLGKTNLVHFESWEEHFRRFSCSTTDIIRELNKHDFTVYRIVDGRNVARVRDGYISTRCENLLAFRDENYFKQRTNMGILE